MNMKNDPGRNKPEQPAPTTPNRKFFAQIPIPFFGRKDRIPVAGQKKSVAGKWSRSSLLWLALACLGGLLILQQCKRATVQKAEAALVNLIYDNYYYHHDDCDYRLFAAASACTYPSVARKDYEAYLDREQGQKDNPGIGEVAENYIRQRPRINMDRLAYYEQLTRDRVRLIYDNGACEIFDTEDLMYNIQDKKRCGQFRGIPQNGEVTEFVNLLYIESFEKINCKDKELYRLKLGIDISSCASLRTIDDCGVGSFGVYVYRRLRKTLEEMNPGTDFKYRRTVACDC
ncbi:hypothetical protein CRP01_35205 [Flavilitoribacter nigricans DSM 23189 = NBRC 102662]|uniref:Uncharacterized protein n=2 Tax=Flavilitoribacter TaxID=2762562 RepID=A0A2D0N0J8_FLAN2|nr:hypothetical protein CRP01_35205 [Flavilitoribacter nigricans DSM 23189 = NBRC 102662]